MEKPLLLVGAALMFFGVAAGAFGAHALSAYFDRFPQLESTYETAVRYLMIHALALFVTAWVASHYGSSPLTTAAGILFVAGIALFCGSLFLLVLTRISWLGAITPLGGVGFLGGWLLLFLAVWRGA